MTAFEIILLGFVYLVSVGFTFQQLYDDTDSKLNIMLELTLSLFVCWWVFPLTLGSVICKKLLF